MSFKFSRKSFEDKSFDSREHSFGKGFHKYTRLELYPPYFHDLGKRTRDLFNTGYHFGLLSLNIITKSPNKVKFTTTCVENINQGSLYGNLEAKYDLSEAVTLTERWNTDCTVTTEICCKNKPISNCNLTFVGLISPRSGDKLGSVKAEWTNKFLAVLSQLDIGSKYSLFTSSAVLGYRGLLGGVMAKFDIYTTKVNDITLAAGFSTNDFILHTSFNDKCECEGSIFHKVTPDLDAGVDVVYSTAKKADVFFGIAGKYKFDEAASIYGKLNNSSQLGLGYEQRLRDCVVLNLSALFDVKNFAEGKHKLGLAIQFES